MTRILEPVMWGREGDREWDRDGWGGERRDRCDRWDRWDGCRRDRCRCWDWCR
jgi:hypothetical protein